MPFEGIAILFSASFFLFYMISDQIFFVLVSLHCYFSFSLFPRLSLFSFCAVLPCFALTCLVLSLLSSHLFSSASPSSPLLFFCACLPLILFFSSSLLTSPLPSSFYFLHPFPRLSPTSLSPPLLCFPIPSFSFPISSSFLL